MSFHINVSPLNRQLSSRGKVIPDKVPVVGYADDLAVFAAAFLINEPELKAYSQWREQTVSV